METLKIGVSGVRGIIGDSLTPDLVLDLSKAFGTYLKGGKVVVGTDSRTSREMLKYSVFAGLLSMGCEVIDVGIVPTPTVQLMVKEFQADGGVIVTASHNPHEWNGLKFVRSDGIFLNAVEGEEMLTFFREKKFKPVLWDQIKRIKKNKSASNLHLTRILCQVDVPLIKKKKFKVVVDNCNGAGYLMAPKLLFELGCEVEVLNNDPNIPFARVPEPRPENLTELCQKVVDYKAKIGFAQDPDADRLALIDENGNPLPEDYTLALVADYILKTYEKRAKGYQKMLVTNLSTTQAVDDVANRYGAKVIRTKVGEVNVAEEMKHTKAIIGGEGNGGVMFPQIGWSRDSLAGMALVLEYLAFSGKKISELAAEIPRYYMVKKKTSYETQKAAYEAVDILKERYQDQKLDLTEGLKILGDKNWVHIRVSNTEPIIRVVCEAASEAEANERCDRFIIEVDEVLKTLA